MPLFDQLTGARSWARVGAGLAGDMGRGRRRLLDAQDRVTRIRDMCAERVDHEEIDSHLEGLSIELAETAEGLKV